MAWVGVHAFREGVQGCAQGLNMARVQVGENAWGVCIMLGRVSRVKVELKVDGHKLDVAGLVERVQGIGLHLADLWACEDKSSVFIAWMKVSMGWIGLNAGAAHASLDLHKAKVDESGTFVVRRRAGEMRFGVNRKREQAGMCTEWVGMIFVLTPG